MKNEFRLFDVFSSKITIICALMNQQNFCIFNFKQANEWTRSCFLLEGDQHATGFLFLGKKFLCERVCMHIIIKRKKRREFDYLNKRKSCSDIKITFFVWSSCKLSLGSVTVENDASVFFETCDWPHRREFLASLDQIFWVSF